MKQMWSLPYRAPVWRGSFKTADSWPDGGCCVQARAWEQIADVGTQEKGYLTLMVEGQGDFTQEVTLKLNH